MQVYLRRLAPDRGTARSWIRRSRSRTRRWRTGRRQRAIDRTAPDRGDRRRHRRPRCRRYRCCAAEFEVDVYERAPELNEVGGGHQYGAERGPRLAPAGLRRKAGSRGSASAVHSPAPLGRSVSGERCWVSGTMGPSDLTYRDRRDGPGHRRSARRAGLPARPVQFQVRTHSRRIRALRRRAARPATR